jgi:outer membrane protein assembly factor BamB
VVRRVRSISIAIAIAFASTLVWGQQPKRNREPYVPALLPVEQKWLVTLPVPPSAAGVMDDELIYIPGQVPPAEDSDDQKSSDAAPAAPLIALERETGATRWTYSVVSQQPPVLDGGTVIVAAGREIHGVGSDDGDRRWVVSVDRPVRAPMIARGRLLVALLEGDLLIAVNLDSREVVWRRPIGESGPVLMSADDEAVYLTTAASRALRVNLVDGALVWEQQLQGELTEPTIDRDRVFVGSNAYLGSLWSLHAKTGKEDWRYGGRQSRIFGGAIVGMAVKGNDLYVVAKDNFLRSIDRSGGNQRWKVAITRPVLPPLVVQQNVIVTGLSSPTLAAFGAAGTERGTWKGPDNAVLQGPPLVAPSEPYRVNLVIVLRDGRVLGLRPAEMLFKEPAPVPLTALPGRPLPREEFDSRSTN